MEETSIHENYTEAYRLFDLIAWISSCNDQGKVCVDIFLFLANFENILSSVYEIPQ